MPYWPIPMTIALVLFLIGLRLGAWVAPAVVLAGYIAMRGVMAYMPAPLVEVAGCALWLNCAFILCYNGAWLPGFFFALSGVTYPALLVLGFRIEYMGLSPIIAAVFGLLALAGMGGGLLGLALDRDTSGDSGGVLGNITSYSLGVAARPVRH